MKTFGVLLSFLMLSSAHASWTITNCSNSDGSVTWKSGQDEDLIHLRYANFVEGTLSLELEKVNIHLSNEVILKEKTFRSCSVEGLSRVYAGRVKITGSEKHPNVLRSQFPENRVVTEVICTTTVLEDIPCSSH